MACAKILHPPSQRIWTWMCQLVLDLFCFCLLTWFDVSLQITANISHCKPSTVTNYKDLLLPGIHSLPNPKMNLLEKFILHNRMVNTLETELSTKSQHKIMLLVTNAWQLAFPPHREFNFPPKKVNCISLHACISTKQSHDNQKNIKFCCLVVC